MTSSGLVVEIKRLLELNGFRVVRVNRLTKVLNLELLHADYKARMYGLISDQPTDSVLTFARIEIGTVEGTPSRWGVLLGKGKVQVALGHQWAVVGADCRVDANVEPITFLELLDVAKRLRPGSTEGKREGSWPLLAFEDTALRPTRFLGPAGGALMGSGLSAAVATGLLGGLVGNVLWLPAVLGTVVGGIMVGTAWTTRRNFLKSMRGTEPVHQALRDNKVFTDVEPVAAVTPEWMFVSVRHGGSHFRSKAYLNTALFGAVAADHELKVRIRFDRVIWPKKTMDRCCIIPDAWATVRFEGSLNALALVPTWHRKLDGDGCIGWLLDNAELEGGELSDLFSRLAGALRTGPYR